MKYCKHCKEWKSLDKFGKNKNTKDGLTFYCKKCQSELSKISQLPKRNDFDHIIRNRWASINQRTSNGIYSHEQSVKLNPQHRSYQAKEIRVEIDFDEFKNFMYETSGTFYAIETSGGKPSIDRIEESRGYELGNLQIIDLHENLEKRLGKPCKRSTQIEKTRITRSNRKRYDRMVKQVLKKCGEIIEILKEKE